MRDAGIQPALDFIIAAAKNLPVDRVILFGSRARGDNGPRADIDLAVDGPELDILQWHKITGSVEDAPTLLPIDCLWLQEADNKLKTSIEREGKTIYVREK